jgi:serine/threonine protein kinase
MEKFDSGVLLHKRYRISKTLGKGGMGMVYLAEDISLNHMVAVKENYGTGEESTDQFLQEAKLLAALRHPNLPRVTDYFIEGRLQYLVMDYLPGDDLQTVLEREGRRPVEMVMKWAENLVDALAYMHSQHPPVTHRDIKPANIRLRDDGRAVLVDFGIAKAAESAQKTNIGAMGYTPGFAPPEQAGGGRTGPYSDQFSLAATLYTLLTGSRPVESIKRILEGAVLVNARVLNSEIPENISAALSKSMALDVENRFSDVQEFFSAMRDPEFRWDERQKTAPNTAPIPQKRPTWMLAAIGLIILLVIAILGMSIIAAFKLAKPIGVLTELNTPSIAGPITGVTVEKTLPIPTENAVQAAAEFTPVLEAEITKTPIQKPTPVLIASGKWIAFSSDRADNKILQIWMMQAGLNNEGKPISLQQKQLTNSEGNKTYPAWSPDGKTLLFSAPSLEKINGLDIWKISAGGGEAVDLTNRKGDDLFAFWSPAGDLISFTNNGRDDGIHQLFFMDSTGGKQQRVSLDYEESQGIWPPDMQALFYVIKASDNNYFYQRASQSEYKTPQPYDPSQVFGRLGQVTDPAFSPDGLLLAYTRTKGSERSIGVLDFPSKGANTNLITKTGKDYDPAWSPDGKWIAFSSERDGNSEIYVMSSAGLIQTNVSLSPGKDLFPAWQP